MTTVRVATICGSTYLRTSQAHSAMDDYAEDNYPGSSPATVDLAGTLAGRAGLARRTCASATGAERRAGTPAFRGPRDGSTAAISADLVA
ncbi:MAG: hypothetical protein NVS1B9_06230 [Solirubrobacteraceae bacterium]